METQVKESLGIRTTKVYSKFSLMSANRDISPANVKRIVNNYKSGIDLFRYNPILVGKDGRIYDGQHRFMACKELGIPVYFMLIGEQSIGQLIKLNNAQKSWSIKDYLNSYIEQGKLDYRILKDFCDKYNVTISVGIELLSGKREPSKTFKAGNFQCRDIKLATKIAVRFNQIVAIDKKFNTKYIPRVLFDLEKIEGYDHKRMINKLHKLSNKIAVCNSVREQLRAFEEAYNHSAKKSENKLRFF